MRFIQGQDRTQTHLFPISLDESIDKDNEVRFIDSFVDSLDLGKLGFKVDHIENGRPAYHPSDLLKLYIYGYLNRIRSSRQLEKETKRNIEVIWLLGCLSPDHNTISNFRRDYSKSIKKVFHKTVQLAQYFKLIGGTLIAGDSTKLRAQNSKKNNFNKKKIERHLAYIEDKLSEYNQELAKNDGDKKEELESEIAKHTVRKKEYQKLDNQLKDTGQSQISTSDSESRHMITRNNITEVAYNIQTTVDSEYNLPIDFKVTNSNDSKAMGNMLQRANIILRNNGFTALYDKGYHTGSEFYIADQLGIATLVAIPGVSSQAPDPNYNVEKFEYDNRGDFYTCPEGQKLTTNGRLHTGKNYQFKRYTSQACLACEVREKCSKAKCGKAIQRSEYQYYIDKNKQRIQENKHCYKRRQAIVEHPYGTIKRQWGFNYIMTKEGMDRASSDVGLIMIAYNLRRLMNLVGIKQLLEWAKEHISYSLPNWIPLELILAHIRTYIYRKINITSIFMYA